MFFVLSVWVCLTVGFDGFFHSWRLHRIDAAKNQSPAPGRFGKGDAVA
jgi:hypothetical protein